MPSHLPGLYGLDENLCSIHPFGNGLINNTWKISCGDTEYILQRINQQVFKQPFLTVIISGNLSPTSKRIIRNIYSLPHYLALTARLHH